MKISERAYTCAVVDDEQIGIEVIMEYISMIPKLTLTGQYLDPLLAVKDIRQAGNVDFLFLDISMSLSGIQVAELLRENAGFVVFITAHPEYALTAFGVQADGFLLKPLGFNKFLSAVNTLIKRKSNCQQR